MASGSYLLLLVVLWYCFSYVFNVATKGYWMATEELGGGTVFPLMASVFVTNAVAGSLWVMHLTSSLGRPAHAAMGFSRIAHVVRSSMWQDFCLLCISGAVGITASIVVLQHGSIQLVQVTRSLGPLFTAAWAYLMLDQTTSTPALGCLLLALAGTVLASWQEPTFCALTAALMLTVNTTLTFRNAATKRILRGFPEAAAALSSGAGLDAGAGGGAAEKGAPGGKLPGSGGSGGSVGSDKGSGGAAPGAAPSRAPPAGAAHSGAGAAAFHSPEALACALLVLTNVAGLVCTLALWGCAAWRGHHAAAAGAARVLLPPDAWRLLLVVGGSNFMYNVASQLCLAHVAVVSHGMLELFKRVFVLLAASALLGDNDWAWHNAAGAGAATLGTILYFCTVRRSGHGNTGRDGPELGALPSLSGPEAVGGGTKNGAHAATVHVALAPTELQLEGSWKAPGEQLKQRGRAAREACAPWAPAAARGGGGHLGAAGAGAGGALGGGWAGDGGGGGSILGGVGGGGGTPSHKLQLAYGLIVAVLLCSPVELAAGAGVTSWTPAWLRPGAEWSRGGAAGGGDSSDGGGLQLGASGGAQHAGGGGGTPVGTSGGGARGGGGALSLAPLDSAAVLARVDAAYVPGPPPLRGGPRMPGVLPYHLSLKRLPDAAGSVPPHCRTLPGASLSAPAIAYPSFAHWVGRGAPGI
ncbi:hypothetical protein FOA52_008969 [Chlamydomonas sp. UWO 241]|nr:hypothetical protein FOA52_008969 [Chlamydomonas sp. UWO 241]